MQEKKQKQEGCSAKKKEKEKNAMVLSTHVESFIVSFMVCLLGIR